MKHPVSYSHQGAQTKKGKKIKCQVILKAVPLLRNGRLFVFVSSGVATSRFSGGRNMSFVFICICRFALTNPLATRQPGDDSPRWA